MAMAVYIDEDPLNITNYHKFPKRVYAKISWRGFKSTMIIGSSKREYYQICASNGEEVTLNNLIEALSYSEEFIVWI